MSTINKDLGMVTAYAYAVAGGYTGTEAEFEELLGSIADTLEEFENFSVTVTTLPAGSSATARYADGILSLGIPKGDKGDQGDRGEQGPTGATPDMSIGTVTTLAPTEPATASITGTAEEPVLNLGIPKGDTGEVSQAELDAVEDAVADLKSDINDINIMSNDLFAHVSWETGQINTTTGGNDSNSVKLRTGYISLNGKKSFSTKVASGYKYSGFLINSARTEVVYTIAWTTGGVTINLSDYPTASYVRFVLQKTNNTLPEDGSYLSGVFNTVLLDAVNGSIKSKNKSIKLGASQLTSGSLQTSSMTVSANDACVSYLTKIPVNGGEVVEIKPPTISGVDHYTYRFGFYKPDGTYRTQVPSTTNPVCATTSSDGYIAFMIVAYDSSNQQVSFNVLNAFTSSDIIEVVYVDRYIEIGDIALVEWVTENFEPAGNGGYFIDAGNSKHGVSASKLGDLKYSQAFCLYNNYYYSIDGSNIAKQDSNFSLIQDTALATGHGNSLQLGNNGTAYASGWNDSTVYVIDLATLTISSSITLPVTGYFSAVVDDLNNIAYILHRTSYPDTVANYTFTAYDITNNSVIHSKVVNAFGALQAMDYVDGKIIVAYGLGTSAVPNGITIYNTNGDIIGTYDLDIFSLT